MNLVKPFRNLSSWLYSVYASCRLHLPRQRSLIFENASEANPGGVGPIYVINLDRQPDRLSNIVRELDRILDSNGKALSDRMVRYSACDGRLDRDDSDFDSEVDPYYTLRDQLFVEPQPHAIPEDFDLARPIKMSRAEIAVARSHIGVWKCIARSAAQYSLVLEDDVIFARDFGQYLDRAWAEMSDIDNGLPTFDVLYASYKEVRFGAPKQLLSKSVFRPERGLWYLSGYVLSKDGAQALLNLLPCKGPIDLWINQQFQAINVRALRKSVINQRRDLASTNSYSILPSLSQIGVINDAGSALFQQRPTHFPVFVFGQQGAALSSLAMALSMLGYRCCNNLDEIPRAELDALLLGKGQTVFNAYVGILSLESHSAALAKKHLRAKFVVVGDEYFGGGSDCGDFLGALKGSDLIRLSAKDMTSWRAICEHLRLPPPASDYPAVRDLGPRRLIEVKENIPPISKARELRRDASPWVVEQVSNWMGVRAIPHHPPQHDSSRVSFADNLNLLDPDRWLVRNDTFPGNLALFRRSNVVEQSIGGISLFVKREPLGVRDFSSAAISTHEAFLYGRFEATMRATDIPGLVTGLFLHRNSPRQEIDIEITGNLPRRLLVNVFYNPGEEGTKFDYGYRGTPVAIPLGFDASKAEHQYAIEWDPFEIRWFVDGALVYSRVEWNPTPIPHLPMTLHVNTWPTRSRELAGRLAIRSLPGAAVLYRVAVDATLK